MGRGMRRSSKDTYWLMPSSGMESPAGAHTEQHTSPQARQWCVAEARAELDLVMQGQVGSSAQTEHLLQAPVASRKGASGGGCPERASPEEDEDEDEDEDEEEEETRVCLIVRMAAK